MTVFAIKDEFHSWKNGDKTPEVRSDHSAFDSVDDFWDWVKQHTNDMGKVYQVDD